MGFNHDMSTDTSELFKLITRFWRWPIGLLIVLFIELSAIFFTDIFGTQFISKEFLFIFGAIITFLVWVVSNKRAFHKTGYWILLWSSIIMGMSYLFPTFIYNSFIIDSFLDLPYIKWGITAFIAFCCVIIYYIIDFKIIHRNKLTIVFLISNVSRFEERIRTTLEEARYKIENEETNINIIIPPFGIVNTVKKCERYINNLFCQADAVVYTRIIDSNDEFGYKFTDFTSRMNCRHVSNKVNDINHNQVLSEASKCKDWNSFNKEGNSITKKEIMANDLYQLLLIYVGCIYLYKSMYSEALPIVDKLFYKSRGDNKLSHLTNELISYAYLTAEQWEEQENQNYNKALQNLLECRSRLPYISTVLRFKLAMARVMLLLGNIKESKKYTKSVIPSNFTKKNVNGNTQLSHVYDWYVCINFAFYAIYERKPLEIISNYRKLFKCPSPCKDEVEFAINFQLNQYKNTCDDQYRMFLLHGMAFLYLYLDKKKSLSYIKKTESYKNIQGYDKLSKLRDIITDYKGKLHLRK